MSVEKKLFVHIGMSRAGSTFLQREIFKAQKKIPTYGSGQGVADGKDQLLSIGKAMRQLRPNDWYDEETIKKLDYLKKGGIFTHETISKVPPNLLNDHLAALADVLNEEYNVRLKVIMVFRSQQDWFVSRYLKEKYDAFSKGLAPPVDEENFKSYVRNIIFGPKRKHPNPNYLEFYESLIEAVGKENVHVDLYERLGDVAFWEMLGDFIQADEICRLGNARKNELSGVVLDKEKTRWLLHAPSRKKGGDNFALVKSYVKNPRMFIRKMHCRFPLSLNLSEEYYDLIRRNFERSNSDIGSRIGVDMSKYGYFTYR